MEKIFTIKNNSVFTRMYRKAKTVPKSTVVVYSWKYKGLKKAAIGITASKKLGGAVERNRARRIIREAYRTLIQEGSDINSKPYYFVFVARKKCFLKTTRMQDVLRDMKSAFDELGIFAEEK
jgi:ribonuclease P protein component